MSDLPPGLGEQIGSLLAGSQLPPGVAQDLQRLYGAQLAQPQAQFGQDTALANQAFGDTIAQLNIQKGALGRQGVALPEQQDLAKQLINLQRQELGLQEGQLGLRGQSLDITERQEREAAQQALQGAQSSATARGAINTQGYGQQRGYIEQNLQNQLAQLGLSRQGIDLQGRELRDISGKRIDIGEQQQMIDFGLQGGSLADQIAQLNLNYGIAGQTQQNAIGQAGINAQSGTVNTGINQITSAANAAQQVPAGAGPAAIGAAVAPPPRPSAPGSFRPS